MSVKINLIPGLLKLFTPPLSLMLKVFSLKFDSCFSKFYVHKSFNCTGMYFFVICSNLMIICE